MNFLLFFLSPSHTTRTSKYCYTLGSLHSTVLNIHYQSSHNMKSLPRQYSLDAIVQLRHGKSARDIAAALGISVSSVLRIRQRVSSSLPNPRRGSTYKVSKKTRSLLARKFSTGEFSRPREGRRFIKSEEGVDVHNVTVRNYLHSESLKGYVKAKRPYLNKKQMANRYQFAKEHLHWTVLDWANVMFSDETLIGMVEPFGRKFYYKRPGNKRIQPYQVKKTKQNKGGKILLWGCLTYRGLGDASWIPGKLNSVSYLDILESYVIQSQEWTGLFRSKFIFQQDNAKPHTSKLAKRFFKKNKIAVMK